MWQIVSKNNSFLVKRSRNTDKAQFSKEPGNLMNVNSFKYSGLANKQTIALDIADGKVSMGMKAAKNFSKPKINVRTTPLNKNFRRVASSIKKQTEGSCYRKDLTAMALARWTALNRLSKVQAGLAKKAKTKEPHRAKKE